MVQPCAHYPAAEARFPAWTPDQEEAAAAAQEEAAAAGLEEAAAAALELASAAVLELEETALRMLGLGS